MANKTERNPRRLFHSMSVLDGGASSSGP
jgi:hypothetical protein